MEATEASLPESNPTAKAFTLTAGVWFAAATSLGMIAAGYLIAPDFLANIEYIHFGRARPMHVNAVLFGFVTPALLAAAFYYIPKLLRTSLFSQKLGVFTAIFWNITVLCGMIGVAISYSAGSFPPDLTQFWLMAEHCVPVCSPGYIERRGPIETPADIAHADGTPARRPERLSSPRALRPPPDARRLR